MRSSSRPHKLRRSGANHFISLPSPQAIPLTRRDDPARSGSGGWSEKSNYSEKSTVAKSVLLPDLPAPLPAPIIQPGDLGQRLKLGGYGDMRAAPGRGR